MATNGDLLREKLGNFQRWMGDVLGKRRADRRFAALGDQLRELCALPLEKVVGYIACDIAPAGGERWALALLERHKLAPGDFAPDEWAKFRRYVAFMEQVVRS